MGIHRKQKQKRACSQMEATFYLGQVRLPGKVIFEQRGKGREGVTWVPRARVFQADAGTRGACAHRASFGEGHCDWPGGVAGAGDGIRDWGGGADHVRSCILYQVRWEISEGFSTEEVFLRYQSS